MYGGFVGGTSLYATTQTGATPVDGIAVSGTNVYYSTKVWCKSLPNVSFHLVWTGTPTGTFEIWVSNKPNPSEANDNDWSLYLQLASPINQPAGAAGNDNVTLAALPFAWVRTKYTNASGSGTIFNYGNAKL